MGITISILGAIPNRAYGTHVNPDTLTTQGFGYIELNADSSPTGIYRGWYILVIGSSSSRDIWQIVSEDSVALFNFYVRKKHDNNWTAWKAVTMTTL